MNDIFDHASAGRRRRAPATGIGIAVAGVVLLIAVQQFATFGESTLLAETLTNAAHIPLFAILTLLLIRILGYPAWWVVLLACLAVAAATEVLQGLTGRDASLLDVARDLLGALPVIGAFAVTRGRDPQGNRWCRAVTIWAATALVLAAVTLAAPIRVLLAYAERDQSFPLLLVPGAWLLDPLLSSNSPMELVPGRDDWQGYAGEPVLEVVWAAQRYPGITLSEVVPDWGAFAFLAVDVYLPEGAPLPLTAALGYEGQPGTAAFLRRTVEPGPQRLLYDLAPLLATADGAPPRVSRLILHTSAAYAGRRLLIGSAALIGDPAHAGAFAGNLDTSR